MKKFLFSKKNFALTALALPFMLGDVQAQSTVASAPKAPHPAAPAKLVTHVDLIATRQQAKPVPISASIKIWFHLNGVPNGSTIAVDKDLSELLGAKKLLDAKKTYKARKIENGVIEIIDTTPKGNVVVTLSLDRK